MKVFIIGKGRMLANIILGAQEAGAKICGVLRYEQTTMSKIRLFFRDFFKPAPEVTLLKESKIPEYRFKSVNSKEFRNLLIKLNVDLLIVGTWKEKITPETYKVPTIATINIHPSLLPKYRGPNPYMQTILHGEKFSGVTIHLVNERYDAGEILRQERVPIYETDTSKELRERTVITARTTLTELLNDMNYKIIAPINQDERYASYYPHISGEERMLDFKNQTSDEISRTIRALHPFLPTYITYNNKFYIVNPYNFQVVDTVCGQPAEIISKTKSSLTIVCKDKKAINFQDIKLYRNNILKKFIKNIF